MCSRFSVISLFAGCGGSSLGYALAGGKVLLAVEWDALSAAVYRSNHPETPVYQGDIADLTADKCMRLAGVTVGELDVLDGSPPCQGLSTVGKRRWTDQRNRLFEEYVRLLRGLKPRVFIMENVSGLVKGKMRLLFAEILERLTASGYAVKCRLMNAKWYGVPQDRARVIFIGVRSDLGVTPSFPAPRSRPIATRDALQGCPVGETPKLGGRYARIWAAVPIGGNASRVLGSGTGFNDCVKLNPSRPAPTITRTNTGRGFATLCHWNEPRSLSIPEAKRLMSFPDTFQLAGTFSQQWGLLGNAVPPLLMKAVAEHVASVILGRKVTEHG